VSAVTALLSALQVLAPLIEKFAGYISGQHDTLEIPSPLLSELAAAARVARMKAKS
jgi:hypothetical protein